jgi:hypothetical protein
MLGVALAPKHGRRADLLQLPHMGGDLTPGQHQSATAIPNVCITPKAGSNLHEQAGARAIAVSCGRLCCRDIKEQKDEELLVLPTDAALFDDEAFKWVPASLLCALAPPADLVRAAAWLLCLPWPHCKASSGGVAVWPGLAGDMQGSWGSAGKRWRLFKAE